MASSVPANTLPPRIDIPRREDSGASSFASVSSSSASASMPQTQPAQAQGGAQHRSPKQPYSLAKSFSERLATLSPRNMMAPPSSLALGPTAAGGNGESTPRSGAATPTKTILQRFHTASPRAGGAASPIAMAAAALRSPSSYRATMGAWRCVV